MDDADLLITASGKFGTFTWELPEEFRRRLQEPIPGLSPEENATCGAAVRNELGRMTATWLCLLLGAANLRDLAFPSLVLLEDSLRANAEMLLVVAREKSHGK